jgi:hypothetical protein
MVVMDAGEWIRRQEERREREALRPVVLRECAAGHDLSDPRSVWVDQHEHSQCRACLRERNQRLAQGRAE